MGEMTLEEYKRLVEKQGQALLGVVQSVALGDLNVQVEVPPEGEGIEILSEVAVGLEMMIDDLQEMMAERVRTQLVEEQSQTLLGVVQSVALGDLDVQIEVPPEGEGIEILSELAIGLEMMIDDLQEMMAEQERARAQIERGRQQLESALQELLAVQRRYVREQWERHTTTADAEQGYFYFGDEHGRTDEAWLPSMASALQQGTSVVKGDRGQDSALALPIKLYGEVIGVLGLGRERDRAWSKDEIAAVESIADQVAQALEIQRLFDEEQQASHLLTERVRELDLLNEIGRQIDEIPPIPEFLQWVAERIPPAMQYPDLCVVAIEYESRIYGMPEAIKLPYQMVQGLRFGDELVGKVYIAYTERREFLNAESAMLGDIVRRVSGFIENRRLFRQTQDSLDELLAVQRRYLREHWQEYTAPAEASRGYLLFENERGPTRDGWLPAMTEAVQQGDCVTKGNGDEDSTLALPIQMYGEVIGTLGFSREGDRPWGTEEIGTVQAIVAEVAEALDKQRLFDETQQALIETEDMYQAIADLTAAQTYDDILNVLRQYTQIGENATNVSLNLFDRPWLGDDVPEWTVPVARWSVLPPDVVSPRYPLRTFSSAAEYLRPDAPILVEDVANDPRLDDNARAIFGQRFGARSTIFVPLVVGGQWIGYVNAIYGVSTQFPEPWVRRVVAVSGQAAVAIQSLRQLEDTQARARREQILREITARVRGFTDPDTLARTAVRELGTALGRPVFIRLGSAEELSQPPPEQAEGDGDEAGKGESEGGE